MEQNKIDMFVAEKGKFFTKNAIEILVKNLQEVSDNKYDILISQRFKRPILMPVVTWFLGFWGVDRFMIGDTGLGVFKLLTFGGFLFFNLYDLFTLHRKARAYNFDLAIRVL